jgi:xylulose-5-phosphate/fructose-6-phosphate phosphoketolase
VSDVEHILWPYESGKRFSIHGYQEKGSTTTPFDLKVVNKVDCYHLAMDLIMQASRTNKRIADKRARIISALEKKILDHQKYIAEYGDDPKEVKELRWEG